MSESLAFPQDGHANSMQIEDHSFWFRHRNQAIVEMIRSFPPAGPVYDVGGGNGYVSLGIKNAGFEAVLVEPGVEGAKNALARGIEPILPATFKEARFSDKSLDAVGIFDVLEHIKDQSDFLYEIHRKLKPAGKLYITVPAYPFLWSQEDKMAGHFRRYTLHALTSLLRQHRFTIHYSSYFFAMLPVPILLFRTLPTWLGMTKTPTLEHHQKQHMNRTSFVSSFFDAALNLELSLLRKKFKIPFGGSCLVCAEAD